MLSPPAPPGSSSSACFHSFASLMVQQLLGDAETCPTRDRSTKKLAGGGGTGRAASLCSCVSPPQQNPPAKKSDVVHPPRWLPRLLGDSPTCPWGQSLRGCAGSGGDISVLTLNSGISFWQLHSCSFFFFLINRKCWQEFSRLWGFCWKIIILKMVPFSPSGNLGLGC